MWGRVHVDEGIGGRERDREKGGGGGGKVRRERETGRQFKDGD